PWGAVGKKLAGPGSKTDAESIAWFGYADQFGKSADYQWALIRFLIPKTAICGRLRDDSSKCWPSLRSYCPCRIGCVWKRRVREDFEASRAEAPGRPQSLLHTADGYKYQRQLVDDYRCGRNQPDNRAPPYGHKLLFTGLSRGKTARAGDQRES